MKEFQYCAENERVVKSPVSYKVLESNWKCIWLIKRKVENFNETDLSQTQYHSFNYLHMFRASQLL